LAEFGLTLETMKKKREIADKLRVLEWELPDVFAWLCTFCDYVGHKLSDDVWYKYPKVCPYCLQPMNCICVIMRREDRPSKEERERRLNHLRKSSAPLKTLDEWVCKLSELYAHINRKLPREATGFHTVEEIGELSQELRRYEENDPTFTQQDFQEEIADVFTWTVGMAIRAGLDLRQILWQKFPGVCPYCGASPCGCPLPG
jgi:NTP pyrophosphatase (non-canonical NTP hydrolase)